jgi:hypothetical protein
LLKVGSVLKPPEQAGSMFYLIRQQYPEQGRSLTVTCKPSKLFCGVFKLACTMLEQAPALQKAVKVLNLLLARKLAVLSHFIPF